MPVSSSHTRNHVHNRVNPDVKGHVPDVGTGDGEEGDGEEKGVEGGEETVDQ